MVGSYKKTCMFEYIYEENLIVPYECFDAQCFYESFHINVNIFCQFKDFVKKSVFVIH